MILIVIDVVLKILAILFLGEVVFGPGRLTLDAKGLATLHHGLMIGFDVLKIRKEENELFRLKLRWC